ncbi:hypothetical protein H6G04_33030 [Calothrix membranacea FACHB-236]|nr:hypothetical protein [Calothrix membranacea FACHB-236]
MVVIAYVLFLLIKTKNSFAVNAAAISPNATILASGSSDNKIRLWNPRTGDPLRTINGHLGEVKSILISPDGEILFSGSADTTIKLWQLATGKLLHTLTGHTDEVKSLPCLPRFRLTLQWFPCSFRKD